MRRMMEVVDGEYQTIKSKDGAYVREHFFNTPELKELVADWSDDDIWNLNRGGHDPHKVYAALPRRGQPQGPADGDPRQDDQGLRHGRVRRGAEHHAPAEEDVARRRSAASATASSIPGARRQARRSARTSRFAEGSPELEYMRARRMELGGYLPARRRKAARARRCRSSPRSSASSRAPTTARSRRRWRSCRSCSSCCATRTSASTSCRSFPTNRARSAWRACSGSSASGTSRGSSTRREDADQLMFYKEIEGRADPAGRHQRGRRDVRLDRGGDVVLDARRADDPVLHLLLDVRLPARRRPRVGGGRHALARLPARRHRRAHDAERRRACSTRTATRISCRRRSRTASRTTRRSATRSR